MGAKRVEYQIVGRYMNGKEVTAYHLLSLETGKAGKFTKEQVAFLVGRDQVTNCSGQIYQDKVLLRGVGMSLEDLPVQYENGDLAKTANIGHIRRGTSTADAMTQVLLAGVIVDGRSAVGYVIQNSGGGQTKVSREQLLSMARAGKVGNARVQMYQGKPILKGVNCDLKQLPKLSLAEVQ